MAGENLVTVRIRGPVQMLGAGTLEKGDIVTMPERDVKPLLLCRAAEVVDEEEAAPEVTFASARSEEVADEEGIDKSSLAPGGGTGKDGAYTVDDLTGR